MSDSSFLWFQRQMFKVQKQGLFSCKTNFKNQLEYSKYSILTNENKLLAEMTVFHFTALKIKLAWIIKVFSDWICLAFKYF